MNILILCSFFIFLSARAMEIYPSNLGKAIHQTFLSSGKEETFICTDLGDDTKTTIKKAVEKNCITSSNYVFVSCVLNALVPTSDQLNDENDLKNNIWINDDIKTKMLSTFCDVVRDEYKAKCINSKIYVSLNNKFCSIDSLNVSIFINNLSYSLYNYETRTWNYCKPLLCYNHLCMGGKTNGCKIRILCFDQKIVNSMKNNKIFRSVVSNELIAMKIRKNDLDNPTLYIIDNKLQDPLNPQVISTNMELQNFLKKASEQK